MGGELSGRIKTDGASIGQLFPPSPQTNKRGDRIRSYLPLNNFLWLAYKVALAVWWLKSLWSDLLCHPVAFHRVSGQESFGFVTYLKHDLHCSFINAVDPGQAMFRIKRDLQGEECFRYWSSDSYTTSLPLILHWGKKKKVIFQLSKWENETGVSTKVPKYWMKRHISLVPSQSWFSITSNPLPIN